MSDERIRILVPCGSLGSGVKADEVKLGLSLGANAIASDAGSTDSGAAYLVLGKAKYPREAIKRDLKILMKAQADANIPLLVGTCGQSGSDAALNLVRDIAIEIAGEEGLSPRIALLYSEQDKAVLKAKNAAGKIKPLPPLGDLADETIDACEHIVAALGPEPYIAALRAGADIVLGGRTTDTAVLSAYALMKGAPVAPSWHAAKVAECGVQCTVNPSTGSGVMITIVPDGFEVEPLQANNRCDPHSVSAHMLYENANPFQLTEPGGVLDVTNAHYAQLDDRVVKVTGSVWIDKPYTMKLEGAGTGRYQTVMLVGIQDPEVLAQIDVFHDRLLDALYARVRSSIGETAGDFHISLRLYGWNAMSGTKPPEGTPPPREVGMLFVATAHSQEMATQIAKACNPYFFHFPINFSGELPSYGFAFSPSEIERGPVYEFKLNHVVETDDAFELVRTEWVDLASREAA
ncbi:acyclic terpene utilization AtuA family protein [Caulobacter sp. SLTY]|nr:acyclic terpene utilization AtuA family protein [Caulobacter sp. SLTY]NBB15435.1 acyclic terpene utilization AtuA family protein [Caulobacter sp. SLTY]